MRGGASRLRASPALALLLGGLLAACDPCSGVLACAEEPRLNVEGQMVEHWSAEPVEGVEVQFVPTGGVALEEGTVTASSGGRGVFRLSARAAEPGEVVGDLVVTPPGGSRSLPPYRVSGVRFRTAEVRGDGTLLDRWVVDPYFPYAGELYWRGAPGDERIQGARVEFRPTAGPALVGNSFIRGVYSATSDAAGRFPLLEFVYAAAMEEVVGDLTVRLPPPFTTTVVRGVRLSPTHVFGTPDRVARIGAGPSLSHVGELYWRATGRRAAGVEVEVVRVGGIAVTPERWSATTDATGRFPLRTRPLAEGDLLVDVRVRPPAPYRPFTIAGYRLSTFDEDGDRLSGIWGIGPHLPYYGVLKYGGAPAAGVEVEVRHAGGVEVEPRSYTTRTDEHGIFQLNPAPLGYGDVRVDLVVRPPAPHAPFTISGYRLPTREDDAVGVLIGVWDIPLLEAK